jgi:hypothetical protein
MPIAFAGFSVLDESTRTDKMAYFKYIVSVNRVWVSLFCMKMVKDVFVKEANVRKGVKLFLYLLTYL